MNDLAEGTRTHQSMSLVPRTMEEAMAFSSKLAQSELVPKDFQGKAPNILVAIQWGFELGLQPMQAMQSIAVINGRPSLWGDAVIALVRASSLCEYIYETVDAGGTSATCRTKRKGDTEEQSRTFTMDDAAKAGLKGKQGPWTNYPKRMLQMRARSWCLRDVYPDVLRGVHVAEEVQDIEKDITPEAEIGIPQPKAAEPKAAPLDAEIVKPAATTNEAAKPEAFAKTEAPAAAAAPAANGNGGGDFNTPASAGQLALIRKKAANAEISEMDICKEFKIDTIDGVSVATGNCIIAFLADPVGYSGKK